MGYGLPKSVEINDQNFSIRYDFRVILTIFEVLDDEELSDEERAYTALKLFFVDFDNIPDYDAAIGKMFWFINGGKTPDDKKKEPELVDWEKDFQLIVSPINRVLGREVRESEYDADANSGGIHWFTFLSAYMEIGDCLFAQVIRIRELKAKGRALDKSDREFYRRNKDVVDIPKRISREEADTLSAWLGKKEPAHERAGLD